VVLIWFPIHRTPWNCEFIHFRCDSSTSQH